MTRRYMNGRYCVRCNKTEPTPYLRKNLALMGCPGHAIDIGCGNMRNTRFISSHGWSVTPIDMCDAQNPRILGHDAFPFKDGSVNLFLANYVFMFLDQKERAHVIGEIQRTAAPGARIMIELYPAKDSCIHTKKETNALRDELIENIGWRVVRKPSERCILVRQ